METERREYRTCLILTANTASIISNTDFRYLEPGNMLGSTLHAHVVASFPGRSHLQFLIACSMQKRRGKGERVTCVTSGRCEGGGARLL